MQIESLFAALLIIFIVGRWAINYLRVNTSAVKPGEHVVLLPSQDSYIYESCNSVIVKVTEVLDHDVIEIERTVDPIGNVRYTEYIRGVRKSRTGENHPYRHTWTTIINNLNLQTT